MISKKFPRISTYADDTQLYISFTPSNSAARYLLKHLTRLSMTFSPGWTWTNCFSIHQKLNFFSFYGTKKNKRLKFSDLTNLFLSNDIISQSISSSSCSQSWLHLWLWHVFLWSNQFSVSEYCHFHIRDISTDRIRHLLPLSKATALANSLSPANLTIAICNSLYKYLVYTQASHKQISTDFNAFKIH